MQWRWRESFPYFLKPQVLFHWDRLYYLDRISVVLWNDVLLYFWQKLKQWYFFVIQPWYLILNSNFNVQNRQSFSFSHLVVILHLSPFRQDWVWPAFVLISLENMLFVSVLNFCMSYINPLIYGYSREIHWAILQLRYLGQIWSISLIVVSSYEFCWWMRIVVSFNDCIYRNF